MGSPVGFVTLVIDDRISLETLPFVRLPHEIGVDQIEKHSVLRPLHPLKPVRSSTQEPRPMMRFLRCENLKRWVYLYDISHREFFITGDLKQLPPIVSSTISENFLDHCVVKDKSNNHINSFSRH